MRRDLASIALSALCSWVLMSTAQAAEGCASSAVGSTAQATGNDVAVLQTTLAGVPAIIRVPKTVKKPPVILWHGLGPPGSESELMSALPLDGVPSVKVYLGLPLFGARAPSGNAESLGQRQAEDYALKIFKPVVVGAEQELPAVLEALRGLKCLAPSEQIGLFGFSAGGTAVLLALRNSQIPVRVAVTVNAPIGLNEAVEAVEHATKKPYVWSQASRQLAEQANSLLHAPEIAAGSPPRALLILSGANDDVIRPAGTESLAEKLRPIYAHSGNAARLSVVIAPGVSHSWAEPGTVEQVRATVAGWFNRYL